MTEEVLYPVGTILKGYGLHNAGMYFTVVSLRPYKGKATTRVESHRTGRIFRTNCAWMRKVADHA